MNVEQDLAINARGVRFPVRQFFVLSVPVAVIIIGIALAFTNNRIAEELDQITATERARLRHVAGFMTAEVSISLQHLLSLAQDDALENAMTSPASGGLQSLEAVFITIARRNPNYHQIRWLDETGAEKVRVVREQGRLFPVSAGELQDKSGRYYFGAADALELGEVFISRLDLNVEHGQIETPIRPTLRVATPVADRAGKRRGILIINIEMKYMLDAIRIARRESEGTDYFLVNKNGYWLTAPKQDDPINLQSVSNESFSESYPDAWKYISANESGTAELVNGFWVWERIALDTEIHRQTLLRSRGTTEINPIESAGLSLKLVAHKSIQTVMQLRKDTRVPIMLGAFLGLLGYVFGILLFLRGLVTEKRAEINVAHALAQASHMERLKELEERFRLLVNASSLGLVVVDAEGTIIVANPAATSMFGYEQAGLEGRSVDQLLPTDKRAQHARMRAEFLRNPEVRKMGQGLRLEALRADGRMFPVEVGLNPYLDRGKQVVLASIVDLSK